ncbi:MAG: alkaline phosphatase family protein [Deltaproteobacteria bacterium]|nr:alkaline phosphatase family protein [Deltaproteobacteria bacterium]
MKVMVIGLDSAVPALVFGQWWDELPNLRSLTQEGMWGEMMSTHPPITVPAWSSMMSGRDPGELGFYGFRNRKDHSYDAYGIANASSVSVDRVWDTLSQQGKKIILLGVPQTYPVKPINGCVVTDFLTPSTECDYTFPRELKEEIDCVADGYVLDVDNFRTDDKEDLLKRIYAKTEKHFKVAKHLVSTRPWDFFMMVEMGVDRIQHGFWSYCDPTHRKYHRGNPFENTLKDYYRYIDKEIGDLLSLVPRDTAVMVVSDHGARKMDGGICINEWLMREGYLRLHHYPTEPKRLDDVEIDWDHTLAWGEGGYHGRLFLNVKGREPKGVIPPEDYEKVRKELVDKIEAIEDPEGKNIGSRAYRPEEIYKKEIRGIPPDLTVYFGDLSWRSVGSLGMNDIYTFENDTGPDEANHDWKALFLSNQYATSLLGATPGRQEELHISQIGPSVLQMFNNSH